MSVMPMSNLLLYSHHSLFLGSSITDASRAKWKPFEMTKDVTLVALDRPDQGIKAHKFVLALFSNYFSSAIVSSESNASVIFVRSVSHKHLAALIKMMYEGELDTEEVDGLEDLIQAATELEINLERLNGMSHNIIDLVSEDKRKSLKDPAGLIKVKNLDDLKSSETVGLISAEIEEGESSDLEEKVIINEVEIETEEVGKEMEKAGPEAFEEKVIQLDEVQTNMEVEQRVAVIDRVNDDKVIGRKKKELDLIGNHNISLVGDVSFAQSLIDELISNDKSQNTLVSEIKIEEEKIEVPNIIMASEKVDTSVEDGNNISIVPYKSQELARNDKSDKKQNNVLNSQINIDVPNTITAPTKIDLSVPNDEGNSDIPCKSRKKSNKQQNNTLVSQITIEEAKIEVLDTNTASEKVDLSVPDVKHNLEIGNLHCKSRELLFNDNSDKHQNHSLVSEIKLKEAKIEVPDNIPASAKVEDHSEIGDVTSKKSSNDNSDTNKNNISCSKIKLEEVKIEVPDSITATAKVNLSVPKRHQKSVKGQKSSEIPCAPKFPIKKKKKMKKKQIFIEKNNSNSKNATKDLSSNIGKRKRVENKPEETRIKVPRLEVRSDAHYLTGGTEIQEIIEIDDEVSMVKEKSKKEASSESMIIPGAIDVTVYKPKPKPMPNFKPSKQQNVKSNNKAVKKSNKTSWYDCEFCSSRFDSQQKFNSHQYRQHGCGFNCLDCNKSFVDEQARSYHIDSAHPFICDICGQYFSTSSAYNEHVQQVHSKSNSLMMNNSQQSSNSNGVKCDFCAKHFSTAQALKLHAQIIHKVKANNSEKSMQELPADTGPGSSHEESGSNRYSNVDMCQRCGQIFHRDLEASWHRCPAVKICRSCGKTFSNHNQLKIHIRKRHNNCCFICGEKFTNYKDKQSHIQIHHRFWQGGISCFICQKVLYSEKAEYDHFFQYHYK